MGRGGEVLPSRDSTRIVKTFILTLQRYELFLKVPNNLRTFLFSTNNKHAGVRPSMETQRDSFVLARTKEPSRRISGIDIVCLKTLASHS